VRFTMIGLPTKNIGNQLPNLGAIYIAQKVRELGHSVYLIDVARYRHSIEDVVKEVGESGPDLVGISGIITAYYYFEPLSIKLKKSFPNLPVVVGGGITCINDIIEKYTDVDYLIKGEGENAISELIPMLDSPKSLEDVDIPGLFVRAEKGFRRPRVEKHYTDISDLAFPAYDLYDMEFYIDSSTQNAYRFLKLYPKIHQRIGNSVRFFPLTLTRGCPYNCLFCYRLVDKFRHPTIRNAIEHLKMVKKEYGCLGINLLDELIVANRRWFIDFCDAAAKEVPGLKIFSGAGRANLLTPEIICHASKAGFVRFGCGIESGSQTILNRLKKRVTVQQNTDAINRVKDAGMMATCNFIFGSPGENKKTLRETEHFIKTNLNPKDYAINLLTAYPGSPIFDYAIKSGMLKREKIHEYVLSLSFGNYPLNFSEFKSSDVLCREISLMQFRLNMSFLWKEGRYADMLNPVLRHVAKTGLYLLRIFTPALVNKFISARDHRKLDDFEKRRQGERPSKGISDWVHQ